MGQGKGKNVKLQDDVNDVIGNTILESKDEILEDSTPFEEEEAIFVEEEIPAIIDDQTNLLLYYSPRIHSRTKCFEKGESSQRDVVSTPVTIPQSVDLRLKVTAEAPKPTTSSNVDAPKLDWKGLFKSEKP